MPGPKENAHGSTVRGLTSSRDACSGLCRQQNGEKLNKFAEARSGNGCSE
jgi:hypothetical protein